jgi:hypothetical protein
VDKRRALLTLGELLDPIVYGLLSSLVVFVGVSVADAPERKRARGAAQVTA